MAFEKNFTIEDWESIEGGQKIFIPFEEYNIINPETEILYLENTDYVENLNSLTTTVFVNEIGTHIINPNGGFNGKITIK